MVTAVTATIVGANGIHTMGVAIGGTRMASCCTFVDILTTWSRVGLSETRFATAKVGTYCVGTSWVWWTVVWSNRTLVNINTSAGSLVSPTCQTDAAVGTWTMNKCCYRLKEHLSLCAMLIDLSWPTETDLPSGDGRWQKSKMQATAIQLSMGSPRPWQIVCFVFPRCD